MSEKICSCNSGRSASQGSVCGSCLCTDELSLCGKALMSRGTKRAALCCWPEHNIWPQWPDSLQGGPEVHDQNPQVVTPLQEKNWVIALARSLANIYTHIFLVFYCWKLTFQTLINVFYHFKKNVFNTICVHVTCHICMTIFVMRTKTFTSGHHLWVCNFLILHWTEYFLFWIDSARRNIEYKEVWRHRKCSIYTMLFLELDLAISWQLSYFKG